MFFSDGMKVDYNQRHIETEKKFYKKMNKKRSFILSLIITGIGYIFLIAYSWSVGACRVILEFIWMVFVAIMFIALTFIGYYVFERERIKWTSKK